LFIVCAIVVVTYAAGYKIDIQNRNITKTSLISIQVDSAKQSVYLNGNLAGSGSQTIRNLTTGNFQVEVKQDDYYDWSKTVDLEPGQAIVYSGIELFLKTPQEQKITGFDNNTFQSLADNSDLTVSQGEIRYNNNLVTRFSGEVTGVSWYPGRQYIAFTNGGKLKIISIDGSNLYEILDKNSTSSVLFTNSGSTVIYESDGQDFQAKIR
jgi:hypothetical protein